MLKISNTALEIKSSLLKIKNIVKMITEKNDFLMYEISYKSSNTPTNKKIDDINNIFCNIIFDGSIISEYKKNIIINGKEPIKGTSNLCFFLTLSGLSIKFKILPILFLYL